MYLCSAERGPWRGCIYTGTGHNTNAREAVIERLVYRTILNCPSYSIASAATKLTGTNTGVQRSAPEHSTAAAVTQASCMYLKVGLLSRRLPQSHRGRATAACHFVLSRCQRMNVQRSPLNKVPITLEEKEKKLQFPISKP